MCSMHIMLSDEIRRADLSLADQMIEKFCVDFELLYGMHTVSFRCCFKYIMTFYHCLFYRYPQLHHECAPTKAPSTLCQALWATLDPLMFLV